MIPLILHPTNWKGYSLVDSGNGKKLERLYSYLADLNCVLVTRLSQRMEKSSGTFLSSSNPLNEDANGKWSIKKHLPHKWEMEYDNIKFLRLQLLLDIWVSFRSIPTLAWAAGKA